MASNSYPYGEGSDEHYSFDDSELKFDNGVVFGASISDDSGKVQTGKGRVFSVVAKGLTMKSARKSAYGQVSKMKELWPSSQVRTDIALLAEQEENA